MKTCSSEWCEWPHCDCITSEIIVSEKKFKTKLAGQQRIKVMNQGRTAVRNGWERKSPYTNCRAEEA